MHLVPGAFSTPPRALVGVEVDQCVDCGEERRLALSTIQTKDREGKKGMQCRPGPQTQVKINRGGKSVPKDLSCTNEVASATGPKLKETRAARWDGKRWGFLMTHAAASLPPSRAAKHSKSNGSTPAGPNATKTTRTTREVVTAREWWSAAWSITCIYIWSKIPCEGPEIISQNTADRALRDWARTHRKSLKDMPCMGVVLEINMPTCQNKCEN